jgi:hypothetical protein
MQARLRLRPAGFLTLVRSPECPRLTGLDSVRRRIEMDFLSAPRGDGPKRICSRIKFRSERIYLAPFERKISSFGDAYGGGQSSGFGRQPGQRRQLRLRRAQRQQQLGRQSQRQHRPVLRSEVTPLSRIECPPFSAGILLPFFR